MPQRQRNLKRMFAEAPPPSSSTAKMARHHDADSATFMLAPSTTQLLPASLATAAAAAELPRSPAQLEADALLGATFGESVSERFEAAEARRASTAPTLLENGELRVGGQLVAQLMDKKTCQPAAKVERSGRGNVYWQRVPCRERPWVSGLCYWSNNFTGSRRWCWVV